MIFDSLGPVIENLSGVIGIGRQFSNGFKLADGGDHKQDNPWLEGNPVAVYNHGFKQ